jgi:hypothetical protein
MYVVSTNMIQNNILFNVHLHHTNDIAEYIWVCSCIYLTIERSIVSCPGGLFVKGLVPVWSLEGCFPFYVTHAVWWKMRSHEARFSEDQTVCCCWWLLLSTQMYTHCKYWSLCYLQVGRGWTQRVLLTCWKPDSFYWYRNIHSTSQEELDTTTHCSVFLYYSTL